jgi:hypothetical protein
MHYALPAKKKYPIETAEQLKTASVYFDKYITNFHPAERAAIAETMEKRASELKTYLDNDWIYNYSRRGATYSPDFGLHMNMRKEACAGKKIDVNGKKIDAVELLEKVASKKDIIPAREMVDLIHGFDKRAGLDNQYDQRVRDPFFTVYGSSTNAKYDLQKVASDMYAKELEEATTNESFISKLAASFGDDFAENFKQDPVNIYDSMPKPEKELIINYARESRDEG